MRSPVTASYYKDGVPIAVHVASENRLLDELEPGQAWKVRNALIRQPEPLGVRRYVN
jgi:hypothetical protein